MLVALGIAAMLSGGVASGALPGSGASGLLGPDGVYDIVLADYPDLRVVLVHEDGQLELQRSDGRRVRDGELEPDGVFVWGVGSDRRLVRVDEAGRIQRVTWGSGRILQVVRDEDGRVVEVLGPGGRHSRLSWDTGLVVEHPLGLALAVTGGEDGWWTVRDGTSRQARMQVDPETGGLAGWEDPRGLVTRIRALDGHTELVGPGGGVWRTASDGTTGWLEQPDGHRWTWTLHPSGTVSELRTPAGGRASWTRDEQGRVLEARHEGQRHTVERDVDGRVVSWTDPSGAELRLVWEGGVVTRVVDASGAAVVIERDEAGRAEVIETRSGGRWSIDRGLDGELENIVDPVGRALSLRRDGSGHVVAVEHGGEVTRLLRDSAGRVSGVVAANGTRTGFVRDAAGRIHKVRQPGRTLTLDRDAAGDVVSVKSGGTEVLVQRDAGGRPLSAGPMRWVRDLLGQVRRLVSPAVDLRLERDILGRVRALMAGNMTVAVQRGPGGQPVRWTGGGSEVQLSRDPAGRPIAETVGDRSIRMERDVRGHQARADGLRGTWRWSRGADAHLLRLEGPDGAGIGVDRDAAGRVVLGRLPGGGLSKRTFKDDEIVERLDDAGGGALARGVWRASSGSGVAWAQSDDGLEAAWRWDGVGALMAVEVASEPEDSWVFGSTVERGPGGWTRAVDPLGRTTELSTGDQWPAWGAVGGAWAYRRDAQGRLDQITGSEGAFLFDHDPFGRLLAVHGPAATWRVEWDAMGRPHRILRPGHIDEVLWAPGQVAGTPLATGPQAATSWLDSGTGIRAWSRGGEGAAAAGVAELPGVGRTYIEDALGVIPIQHTLAGSITDSAALAPIGSWGGISLFTGGPELMAGVALEPAGLERTDGTVQWPWQPRGRRPAVLRAVWDDAVWSPEVDWGDPLSLARALGVVEVPKGQGSLPGDVAVPWLPQSLDSRPCPVGPAPGRVGLEDELEPLVWRIVVHLTTAEGPLDWDTVTGPLIDPDEVGRLPPGLRVPGLHDLDAPPDRLQTHSLERKVLASWPGLL